MRTERLLATGLSLGLAISGWTALPSFQDVNRNLGSQAQGYTSSLFGQGGLVTGTGTQRQTRQPVYRAPVQAPQGRIFWWQGKRYIRVRLTDRFEDISREAYGIPDLWFLIYYQNIQLFRRGAPQGNGEIVLYLPPGPRERVGKLNGVWKIQVIPGDTFSGLAAHLWGDAGLWPLLHQVNARQLPNPSDPNRLFRDPPQVNAKIFDFPSQQAIDQARARRPAPKPRPGTPGTRYPPVANNPAPVPGGRVPGALGALNIRSAADVGEAEARVILQAAGFFHDRIYRKHSPPARNRFEAAMMALKWGKSYKRPRSRVAFDGQMRQWVFEEYRLLSAALQKYGSWSTISARTQPQAYQQWVSAASRNLTEVAPAQREALMRSLMQTESGKTHWTNHQPIVSHAGAVGFGQFLPATARGLGINHYDPQQNLAGIALYVNKLIRDAKRRGRRGRSAVQWALAAYNGGANFPRSSIRYAEGILGRLPGRGSQVA